MKNQNLSTVIVLVMLLSIIGCTSNKGSQSHSHTDGSHSHDTTEEVSDYYSSYSLVDNDHGTETKMTVNGTTRKMVTNALPNHDTGTFPNQGNPNTITAQNKTYEFPLNPVNTGNPSWVREPGVALNGVKFEPGTAEVVVCDTGENYRVEAFQDIIDLGLDFNNAHVQPTGEYHYHGTPTSVIKSNDTGVDLIHVGFAHDGFPMYYSKSNAYKPSYSLVDGTREGEDCTYSNPMNTMNITIEGSNHDGAYGSDFEFIDGSGDLDECNGITIDGQYMYLVTQEFPYVSRCLMGEVNSQQGGPQGGGRGNQQGGRSGQGGGRKSAKELIKNFDANKDGKLSIDEVKGPLKSDFTKLDSNSDGFLSEKEITTGSKAMGGNRPPRN